MAINFPSTSGQATDGSYTHTASGITWAWDGTTWKAQGVTTSYVLPIATANALGGIKVGSRLTINSTTGVLDADVQSGSSYTNSDVDTHLNTSSASTNQILSWNGSDYAWVADQTGGGGSSLTIQDEGNGLATAATTLNFVGAGVVASGTSATKTITIAGASGSGEPEITWTLGANGSTDYTFTGSGFVSATNDPTLYLIRGQTYKFDNQTTGHPFRIQTTVAQTGGGTLYSDGITTVSYTHLPLPTTPNV